MRLKNHVFALAWLCGISPSLGQISINIRTDITSGQQEADVRVTIANLGKEEARDVQISLRGKATVTLPRRSALAPGASYETKVSLPAHKQTPGRYPVFVTVGYADRNGYQFSAIQCATYSIGQDTSADIFGTLKTSPLADAGAGQLQLKNLAPKQRRFTLQIFTPRELSVSRFDKEVTLQAGEERSLGVGLRNFSALPGSHYPVYAVVEYEEDERHFTNVIVASVDIIEQPKFLALHRSWILLAARISLAVVFLTYLVRARRKHPAAKE